MYLTRLINSGSNCYMNSTLQGISSCTGFINDIHQLSLQNANVPTLKTFKELLVSLSDGKIPEMNAWQNQIFNDWKKSGQQDSFELLSYLISHVYNKLRKELKLTNLSDWLKLQLPMRIITLYEIECDKNHRIKCPLQASLALHVPIPTNTNKLYDIQTLVELFLEVTDIEDYVCDKCTNQENNSGVDCDSTKSTKSDTSNNSQKNKSGSKQNSNFKQGKSKKYTNLKGPLPNTICIHLQRTVWKRFYMSKIDTKVTINETLQIKYFVENSESGTPKIESYLLKSVIVHSGTPFFGHYICYKNVEGKWYYTSDKSIKRIETSGVPDCQAYILFYEKDN